MLQDSERRQHHLNVKNKNYARRKAENPLREKEKARRYLLKQYNLTIEDYEEMVELQRGMCVICGNKEQLHVDHDHNTGIVRGLLCKSCNTGLGLFRDNIKNMQRAVEYLEES